MAQFSVHSPLDECDLDDNLRFYPVRTQARQTDRPGKRTLRNLERAEPCAEVQQHLRIEAGADLAGEHEIVAIEIPHEQRSKPDASALGVCEPADHELLCSLALH